MGLFEDAILNVKSVWDTTSKKAGQFIDVSRLRINAVEVNNKISEKLEELGKSVYNDYKNQTAEQIDKADLIDEIDAFYSKLEKIKRQICFMQNRIKCPECSFENAKTSVYCSKCGAKILNEK